MKIKQDLLPLLKETWAEFQKDEAGQLGAALAYYAMFSIFPLLILLLAVFGFVLNYWTKAITAQQQVLATISQTFSPQMSKTIGELLQGIQKGAGAATGIGLITLLLGASGVFQQLDLTFNKIWKVPETKEASFLETAKKAVTQKLFSFGMVLAISFLLLISLVLSGATQVLLQGAGALLGTGPGSQILTVLSVIVTFAVTLGLDALIFALLFKYLPDTKVHWGDVWVGAVATALIWEIAKRLLAIYIGRSSYASAYGAVGTVLVLMAWIFFSSQILFLGAEFTKVYAYRHGSRATTPKPLTGPILPPATASATPAASNNTVTVAVATGAGLLIGAVGGAIAGIAALIIGTRRAVSVGARRLRR